MRAACGARIGEGRGSPAFAAAVLLAQVKKFWRAPGAMPDAPDLNRLLVLPHSVDNPVVSSYDLSDSFILPFPDLSPHLRHVLEWLDRTQYPLTDSKCSSGVVASDVADDLAKIVARQRCPD